MRGAYYLESFKLPQQKAEKAKMLWFHIKGKDPDVLAAEWIPINRESLLHSDLTGHCYSLGDVTSLIFSSLSQSVKMTFLRPSCFSCSRIL